MGLNILVDCGIVQGNDFVEPMERWPVAPVDIDYLFLTHAHVDHIGRVPELIRRGFRGEIIATHPTKALLTPMLEDALGFQDLGRKEAARLLEDIDELSWGFELGRDIMKYSKTSGGYVMLENEKLFIRAKVHALTGYSAHADQKGLLDWVRAMPGNPGKIKLVHGGRKAQEALKGMLRTNN